MEGFDRVQMSPTAVQMTDLTLALNDRPDTDTDTDTGTDAADTEKPNRQMGPNEFALP